ncbi:MAG: Kdo hydroxylase family protein, partial [Planctomycetaceae bacterium]|nr:Kdo hydroxylase family protein [Planctomycetaceae bacterium]
PKDRWEFPPDSTWIVFTDTTSHSCISGQYALEQTFIVRRESLVSPDKAPIAILERMSGFPLGAPRSKSA